MSNQTCVGPLALFDPLYVPPELLYRKKEEEALNSILQDALSDSYGMNILYQGFKGIGKKALILKILNSNFKDSFKINIDCKEKTLEELIFTLITSLSSRLNINFDLSNLINANVSRLWNLFKLICQKPNNNLFLIFNNSEYLEPTAQKKFLTFGKNSKITIISTVNKVLRNTTLDSLSYYDLKRKLNYYTYSQLLDIFKQRAKLSFTHDIDTDLLEYITDVILENYAPVPGVGINILKELYPLLKDNSSAEYQLITEACSYHLDPTNNIDEFNLLNYLSEENMLTIIFLDNLTNYFTTYAQNFYISLKDLRELYFISTESLEYKKTVEEFIRLITTLKNIGLIHPSKKDALDPHEISQEKDALSSFYFLTVDPNKLRIVIDTIFH
jgi:hypothetical protein